MAKLRNCDECGQEDLCKPGEILPGGVIKWLCDGCREVEDYVKPKVSKRINYFGDENDESY
jgi:hypothetical protein